MPSLVRLRVIDTADNETSLTVYRILSIDGVPYDPSASVPEETSLSSRVTVLEEALASTIQNLNDLVEAIGLARQPTTTPASDG